MIMFTNIFGFFFEKGAKKLGKGAKKLGKKIGKK